MRLFPHKTSRRIVALMLQICILLTFVQPVSFAGTGAGGTASHTYADGISIFKTSSYFPYVKTYINNHKIGSKDAFCMDASKAGPATGQSVTMTSVGRPASASSGEANMSKAVTAAWLCSLGNGSTFEEGQSIISNNWKTINSSDLSCSLLCKLGKSGGNYFKCLFQIAIYAFSKGLSAESAVSELCYPGTDWATNYNVSFNGDLYNLGQYVDNEIREHTLVTSWPSALASSSIGTVTLTLNTATGMYTGSCTPGYKLQYYNTPSYGTISGSNLSFSVPASVVESWTQSDGYYTSGQIIRGKTYNDLADYTVWGVSGNSNIQRMLTYDNKYDGARPQDVNYTLRAEVPSAPDIGNPGAGGGYYGGLVSGTGAAGGGSGYVGSSASGTTMDGATAITSPSGSAETGHSSDGYGRIELVTPD